MGLHGPIGLQPGLRSTADDGSCTYPEEGLTCPNCDLEVELFTEDLEGEKLARRSKSTPLEP